MNNNNPNKPTSGANQQNGQNGNPKPQQGGQYGYQPQQQGGQYGCQPQQQGGQYGYQQPQQSSQYGYQQPQQGGQYGYQQPQQGGQYGYQQPQQGGQFGYQQPQQQGGQYGFQQPQQPKPAKKKLPLIIIGAVLCCILLVGIGAGGTALIMGMTMNSNNNISVGKDDEEESSSRSKTEDSDDEDNDRSDKESSDPLESSETGHESSTESSEGGIGNPSKGKVYWLNFKPESDETLQEVARMYTNETGISVKVVTAASGTYEQTLSSEMDKSDAPTLFVIGNSAGVDRWGDYALDLRGTPVEREVITDAFNLYDNDGKLVSIGYSYEAYGIIVNPDLLAKAGHSVSEIKDFDSLKTVVEDIHKRAGRLGFDAFTSCDMDDSSSWRFTGHMANLEYFYEERDSGSKWTKCPPTITGKYLPNYKKLFDLCINNSISDPKELATGGHDASEQFRTKKAAFTVQGSWEYYGMKDYVPNAVMIPYYCGVEGEERAGLNCGTENCWAVNKYAPADDQAATLAFLEWCVTDEDASRLLVDTFGVMPYEKAAKSTNPFLVAANDYMNEGCYNMDWATNFQPNVNEYREDLVSALNTYCANQSSANWEKVRRAFVDGWAENYDDIYY